MGKNVQMVRHTADNAATYLGLQGQITVDYTNNFIHLHDGTTAGGHVFYSAEKLATLYQPLTDTLTQLAGLATTAFGRTVLTTANADALVTTLGLDDAVDTVSGDAASGLAASRTGNAVTLSANIASQAEAQAGTATNKLMTPLRVAQAISVLTPAVPVASQAEAEAGIENAKFMTPLRTAQATAYLKPKYELERAPANWMLGALARLDYIAAEVLRGGTQGDLLYFNSAQAGARLAAGTAGQVLSTGGSGANPSWAWGSHVQRVYASSATYTTVANAQIPGDDTIPQSNEGSEIITATITPKAATHRLRVTVLVPWQNGASNDTFIMALFQDSSSNAFAATWNDADASTNYNHQFVAEFTANTTVATTIKLRCGMAGASKTFYLNGSNSNRLFGGTMAVQMIIDEFKA